MKILEEIIPGGQNTRCKGREAGVSLLHLRNRKQANVEGIREQGGRKVGDEACEVSNNQLM